MTRTHRLQLLRQNHGITIQEMARLLRFRSAWHFQDWHQRVLGDIYHPMREYDK